MARSHCLDLLLLGSAVNKVEIIADWQIPFCLLSEKMIYQWEMTTQFIVTSFMPFSSWQSTWSDKYHIYDFDVWDMNHRWTGRPLFTSQDITLLTTFHKWFKMFSQDLLIASIDNWSSLYGINMCGPIRAYFWTLPLTSVLNLCMTSSHMDKIFGKVALLGFTVAGIGCKQGRNNGWLTNSLHFAFFLKRWSTSGRWPLNSSLIHSCPSAAGNQLDLINITFMILMSGIWIIDEQEGPCSPARTLHFRPLFTSDLECFHKIF